MQGLILLGFRRFVRERFSSALWRSVQERTDSQDRIYLPVQTYSEGELTQLVSATATLASIDPQDLLEKFGAFFAPDLMRTYAQLLDPRWKLLDLLENVGAVTDRVITLKNGHTGVFELRGVRRSEREVTVMFASRHRLCALVKGMIEGLAEHMREEPMTVVELRCAMRGHRQCEMSVAHRWIVPATGARPRSSPPPRHRSSPPPPRVPSPPRLSIPTPPPMPHLSRASSRRLPRRPIPPPVASVSDSVAHLRSR